MCSLTKEEFFEKGEIIPFFQPIKSINEKKIYKYEVLCRVRINKEIKNPFVIYGEKLSPEIYKKITEDIVSKVIHLMKDNDLEFSINLTKYDLEDKVHLDKIKSIFKKSGMGGRIVFEITEGEQFKDVKFLNEIIEEFKNDLNCKFALDDFGKGYSNIIYISDIKFDFIKFDGSIVKKILESRTEQIINYLATLFVNLGMEVVAEFVINEDIYNKLEKLRIKYIQGEIVGLASEKFKD